MNVLWTPTPLSRLVPLNGSVENKPIPIQRCGPRPANPGIKEEPRIRVASPQIEAKRNFDALFERKG
jgi:hypothetical protein